MYCMQCGVKLADSEHTCPLCGLRAYHPDLPEQKGERLYPATRQKEEKVNPSGALFLLTVLFLIPALITLLIDLRVNQHVDWSGYVIGSLIVLYTSLVLPAWFRRPNPVIFLPCSLASIALLCLYICINTGGKWFLSFAFPLIGSITLVLTAVVALIRYLRKGYLYIFGGAILLSGALTVPLEFLINLTFRIPHFSFWSLYPIIGCLLIGMALIVIAISRPLRESLHKKFFL